MRIMIAKLRSLVYGDATIPWLSHFMRGSVLVSLGYRASSAAQGAEKPTHTALCPRILTRIGEAAPFFLRHE